MAAFAGQINVTSSATAYPVTQPVNAKVNADGSLNVDTQIPATGGLTPLRVSFSAAGDATLLAGTTGTTIKLYKAVLSATASTSLQFKSGAVTTLSGAIA